MCCHAMPRRYGSGALGSCYSLFGVSMRHLERSLDTTRRRSATTFDIATDRVGRAGDPPYMRRLEQAEQHRIAHQH